MSRSVATSQYLGTSVLPLLLVLLVVLVVILFLTHERGEFLLFDGAHFRRTGFFVGNETAAGLQPGQEIGLLAQGSTGAGSRRP